MYFSYEGIYKAACERHFKGVKFQPSLFFLEKYEFWTDSVKREKKTQKDMGPKMLLILCALESLSEVDASIPVKRKKDDPRTWHLCWRL